MATLMNSEKKLHEILEVSKNIEIPSDRMKQKYDTKAQEGDSRKTSWYGYSTHKVAKVFI